MSKIIKTMHEQAKGLHKIGLLDDTTMRKFDMRLAACVKEITPDEVKRIRKKSRVSQAVFASLLNVSKSTVRHWEQGVKPPSGAALKLLSLVDKHGIEILVNADQETEVA